MSSWTGAKKPGEFRPGRINKAGWLTKSVLKEPAEMRVSLSDKAGRYKLLERSQKKKERMDPVQGTLWYPVGHRVFQKDLTIHRDKTLHTRHILVQQKINLKIQSRLIML